MQHIRGACHSMHSVVATLAKCKAMECKPTTQARGRSGGLAKPSGRASASAVGRARSPKRGNGDRSRPRARGPTVRHADEAPGGEGEPRGHCLDTIGQRLGGAAAREKPMRPSAGPHVLTGQETLALDSRCAAFDPSWASIGRALACAPREGGDHQVRRGARLPPILHCSKHAGTSPRPPSPSGHEMPATPRDWAEDLARRLPLVCRQGPPSPRSVGRFAARDRIAMGAARPTSRRGRPSPTPQLRPTTPSADACCNAT